MNFKNWTIGHTSSVFVNEDVWVNIADFDGPPVGVWVGQPQIRYTLHLNGNNSFNFSVEEPALDFRRRVNIDTLITPTKSYLPDLSVNYRHRFTVGNFQIAVIGRVLAYQNGTAREKTYGTGQISAVPSVFKKDQLICQGLAGMGIERYLVGLTGYGLDAVSYQNKLYALPVYGGYLGYQHYWNDKMNSN